MLYILLYRELCFYIKDKYMFILFLFFYKLNCRENKLNLVFIM